MEEKDRPLVERENEASENSENDLAQTIDDDIAFSGLEYKSEIYQE